MIRYVALYISLLKHVRGTPKSAAISAACTYIHDIGGVAQTAPSHLFPRMMLVLIHVDLVGVPAITTGYLHPFNRTALYTCSMYV